MVSSVAWPARLVSAYAIAAFFVLVVVVPDATGNLALAVAVVLVAHVPIVAMDLVPKADTRRATARVARDRSRDFAIAGEHAARFLTMAVSIKDVLATSARIRRATTEPITRRRMVIQARHDGYLSLDPARMARAGALLDETQQSPLRTGSPAPSLVLLEDPGATVSANEVIAVVEVDEPEVARRLLPAATELVDVKRLPSVRRAYETLLSLARVFNSQSDRDAEGANETSRRIEILILRFLRVADDLLATKEAPEGYLAAKLSFGLELGAVRGFESAWYEASERRDEAQVEVLREHALRLARLTYASQYSSAADILIARLDVAARTASAEASPTCAALMSEVAGIVCEAGRRGSFFPARVAMESMLDRLVATTPLPRQEELVRQRFEEMLGRAMRADYFLEVQVERGCMKLVSLSLAPGLAGRKQRIDFGLAKLGGAALAAGRVALATRIAFFLRDAKADIPATRSLYKDESYRLRMSTLSSLAGGVFGTDVGETIGTYLDWVEKIHAAFPSPATVTPR